MNYYIADLHLFCNSQVGENNLDNRPFKTLEEMHKCILDNWNSTVTNADTVYILGDVGRRGKNDALIALVSQLRGKKVLVVGNHDDLKDYRYKKLYDRIVDYEELTDYMDGIAYKLVLSHYPIMFWNGQHRLSILLYGHTHNTNEDEYFKGCVIKLGFVAINVGCMKSYMNYTPRTLKEILRGKLLVRG